MKVNRSKSRREQRSPLYTGQVRLIALPFPCRPAAAAGARLTPRSA